MATTMEKARGGNSAGIQTVDDLLAKMREGTQTVFDISLRSLTVPVRVLSQDEHNEIRRNAIIMNKQRDGDETDFNILRQKLTLRMASELKPGLPGMFSDKFLAAQSLDELAYWYKEYVRVCDVVNPNLDDMSTDQFRAIVDALKKNSISASDLSMPQLRQICTSFVDLIQRLEEAELRAASTSGGPPSG